MNGGIYREDSNEGVSKEQFPFAVDKSCAKIQRLKSISVDGDEEFTDDIERVIDSKIKIKYHTFKDK